MRRWFLSYNTQDLVLMQGVEAALRRKDADAHIFFAPKSLRVGGYWLPSLADAIMPVLRRPVELAGNCGHRVDVSATRFGRD